MNKRPWISLSKKIAWLLLAIALVSSIATSLIQISLDYTEQKQKVRDFIANLRLTTVPSISSALWHLDVDQIALISNGILLDENIVSIKVLTPPYKSPYWENKSSNRPANETFLFTLLNPEEASASPKEIGKLEISVSYADILSTFYNQALRVLIIHFLKASLVAALAMLIVNRKVILRLRQLQNYISNSRSPSFDINSSIEIQNALKDPDEIQTLTIETQRTLNDLKIASEKFKRELEARQNIQTELSKYSMQIETIQSNAGIFHDLNNLLTALVGQLTLAEAYTNDNAKTFVKKAANTTSLIIDIIKAQQDVSKAKDSETLGPVKKAIQDLLLLDKSALKNANIEATISGPSELELFYPRSLLMLVLLNLVKNAREAITEAKTANGKIAIEYYVKDSILYVSVSDNGPGIPQYVRDKLFEYGNTSKSYGHGFGLNSCKKALNQIGGTLTFNETTTSCQGSTFTVSIPINFPVEQAA